MTSGFAGAEKPSSKRSGAGSRRQKLLYLPTTALTPAVDNPRKHPRAQVRAIAKSIETFGFTAPLLVDKNLQVIAGHGRLEAAKLLGLTSVPVISLDHLTEAEALAYRLADNKLADRSTWDDAKVAAQLKKLTELALDFEIEATGFELPEIDLRIQSQDEVDAADRADEFDLASGPAVSKDGDLWHLGDNRLCCGDVRDPNVSSILMGGEKASAAFTDPPYNLPIAGHVSGKGSIRHREFAMASGEMSAAEFTAFLTVSQGVICAHTVPGALLYISMSPLSGSAPMRSARSTCSSRRSTILSAKVTLRSISG